MSHFFERADSAFSFGVRRNRVESNSIQTDWGLLHYTTSGDVTKQAVVLIHGLTGNSSQLKYYAEGLMKDHYVVCFDLLGRGNSVANSKTSNLGVHAQSVAQALSKLEITNPVVIGYSMGGFIAMLLAQKQDVKAIVLLDSGATMSDHQRKIVEPGLARLEQVYPSRAAYEETMYAFYTSIGVGKGERLKDYLSYELKETESGWTPKAEKSVVETDWSSFWDVDLYTLQSRLQMPMMLVECRGNIGANPPLFREVDFKNLENTLNHLEVVVCDENHYTLVMNAQPTLVQKVVDFIKRSV